MNHFKCHAFEPVLELVSPSENKTTARLDHSPKRLKKESHLRLFHSDKIKYERALALQRLGRDPDGVYVQLEYHFAWNVFYRRSVFSPTNDFIGFVHDTFLRCSEPARGYVNLLYLAPDHVHLYAELDGELSVDEVVQEIKRFSTITIIEEFPAIKARLDGSIEIWDETYFVETVG